MLLQEQLCGGWECGFLFFTWSLLTTRQYHTHVHTHTHRQATAASTRHVRTGCSHVLTDKK